jgi:hypothetical protein
MNRTCFELRLVVAAAAVVFAVAHSAFGSMMLGFAGDPAPPPGPFVGDDNNNDLVSIFSPVGFALLKIDEHGSPWRKELVVNRDGQGWSTSGDNSTFNLIENVDIEPHDMSNIFGPPHVTDWHEVIDTTVGDGANFKWVAGGLSFPPSSNSIPGTVSADGKTISFDPAVIPVFAPFQVRKQLMWAGPATTPGPNGTNTYHIFVDEVPSGTPEPSGLCLAMLGLLGPLFWRRFARQDRSAPC